MKSKLTPEVHNKIVKSIREGNYDFVAAKLAGVTQGTFYQWLKRGESGRGVDKVYAQFHDDVKTASAQAEADMVGILVSAGKDNLRNWTAAATYLERKHPDRWGRREAMDINFSQGMKVLESLQKALAKPKQLTTGKEA